MRGGRWSTQEGLVISDLHTLRQLEEHVIPVAKGCP